jgi:hypothetical protein
MNQQQLIAILVEIDPDIHRQLTDYVSYHTQQDLQKVIQEAIRLFLNRT